MFQMSSNMGGQQLGQTNRHGVAKLPHRFRPRPVKDEIIGKHLKASAFSHGQIAHGTIRSEQHVFPSGNPVDAGLERLRRFVQRAAGMTGIAARSSLKTVVWIPGGEQIPLWIGKIE